MEKPVDAVVVDETLAGLISALLEKADLDVMRLSEIQAMVRPVYGELGRCAALLTNEASDSASEGLYSD